ncbi:MraY family glycosyltransferase [Bacteroides bouchesdurhonensis]|uniref:MraY family glycosyltransferase n=1 Tax=Bacteroides bouchesdurhonensis TaxID=1841855 RepID=UPI0022DF810B|nr:glycosyltransferase family 4 protein [Bacteroides bouchesdurhonensis]
MVKLLIISVLLFALELFYFKIADHFNIIDKPNQRSSHTSITLRGGGIIFLFGVGLYAAFFGFQYPWFLLGLSMIAVISFIDDVHSVSNKYRIIVHFTSMLFMFYQWGIFTESRWWIALIALIVCTGIINAYNFMDGINGITGGYSLAVLIPLAVINYHTAFIDMNLIWASIVSVIIFCFFNFRKKAKCFAGDVGAVSIAFLILFILGDLIITTGNLWYILLLSVYGIDSVLTICHRIILHENIFDAHRKHAYQLMANELKMPHIFVASFYMVLQLAISFGLMFAPINKWVYFVVVILVLALAYVLFKKKYYHLHEEYLKSKEA